MARSVFSQGRILDLDGPLLQAGDDAPAFSLQQLASDGIQTITWDDFAGKTVILSTVPSLDTTVCATMARRLDCEAAQLPDNIVSLTVSADLPFAQARFWQDNSLSKAQVASDHLDVSFGRAYGVLISSRRLLARALFVVDPSRKIRYAEYCENLASEPNYEAAIAAARGEGLSGDDN